MIKKYLLGLLVGIFLFIGFSYGIDVSLSNVFKNGSYNTSPDDSSIEFAVYNRGMLGSTRLGNTKRMIAFRSSSSSTKYFSYFFWYNSYPAFYNYRYVNSSTTRAVTSNRYFVCGGTLSPSVSSLSNCTVDQLYDINSLGTFFNSISSSDYWGYKVVNESDITICFSSNNMGSTVCFNNGTSYSTTFSMSGNLDFVSFPNSYLGDPPGRSTAGNGGNQGYENSNGGITLDSTGSALNYYENTYGWDESICYVGVDNVTTLYGTNGVSFQQGKGLSIFDTFEAIYGNRDINKVYVWLNSWLLNYEQWFGLVGPSWGNTSVGNPSYLVYYNSTGNTVDIYYDNLTFPFANQPVAFYFMADNIDSQSPYYTMGSEVVSYCNIKINNGTYDEIIDQANKNNINNYTEQHNKNGGLNPDGSNIEHDGYFGSGVNIAFSGNTSIKNTLKNFFEEFDKSLGVIDVNTNNRILPTWLVSAFIFVVLFKFLRKR